MKIKQFKATAPKFNVLNNLAVTIQTGTKLDILFALDQLSSSSMFKGKTGWQVNFAKLRAVIVDGQAQYSIFAMGGNSKLPFVAFSTLPGVTCPGAGACLDFCYSYRAWRYPASFMRQAQNAYLMRFAPNKILEAFDTVDAKFSSAYDMRLYVDGDFASALDVDFWFEAIKARPKARVYGYSKSFEALLSYAGTWPENYMLNVSSGHNASAATVEKIKALPITRGEFIAVSLGKKIKSTDHGTKATNSALREAFGSKAFPCPGTCGTCTGKGHACGMQALRGIPIIIAIH